MLSGSKCCQGVQVGMECPPTRGSDARLNQALYVVWNRLFWAFSSRAAHSCCSVPCNSPDTC